MEGTQHFTAELNAFFKRSGQGVAGNGERSLDLVGCRC
jgi:hypothetical protein